MKTIILTQDEVRACLPMERCVDLMEHAFVALSSGDAINPLRRGMLLGKGGALIGMMPGYLPEPEALGIKVLSVFPGNHGSDYDSHQGLVILFDPEHGVPAAIMDASEVTAIRTAAASGAATRALAREHAGDLAILGSGVQARTHLEAMRAVRPVRRVRVYSPTPANREVFAATESKRHGMDIEPMDSARAAVDGADLICTTTSSDDPVLLGEWVRGGAHINAVGSCTPRGRELDNEAMGKASLFTDCRESLLAEAGDFILARNEGELGDDDVCGEIGEVIRGEVPGRQRDDEVTLFKSLGVAVEDLVSAHHVVAEARKRGLGTEIAIGGLRHAPV